MTQTYDIVVRVKKQLSCDDTENTRELIADMMPGFGDLAMWLEVFSDDDDMIQRFNANKDRIQQREPLLLDSIR